MTVAGLAPYLQHSSTNNPSHELASLPPMNDLKHFTSAPVDGFQVPYFDGLLRNQATQIEGLQKQKIQLITTDTMPGGEYELNYAIRFGCAVSARCVRKLSLEKHYDQAHSKRLTSKIASEWNQWWGELR